MIPGFFILLGLIAVAFALYGLFQDREVTRYSKLLKEKVEIYKQQKEFVQSVRDAVSGKSDEGKVTDILRGLYMTLDNSFGPFIRMSLFSVTDGGTKGKLIGILTKETTSITAGIEVRIDKFRCYDLLAVNKVYVENDLGSVDSPSETDRILYQEGVRSYLCKPLYIDNILVGLINISSSKKNHFDEDLIHTIEEAFEPIALSFPQAMELILKQEQEGISSEAASFKLTSV